MSNVNNLKPTKAKQLLCEKLSTLVFSILFVPEACQLLTEVDVHHIEICFKGSERERKC